MAALNLAAPLLPSIDETIRLRLSAFFQTKAVVASPRMDDSVKTETRKQNSHFVRSGRQSVERLRRWQLGPHLSAVSKKMLTHRAAGHYAKRQKRKQAARISQYSRNSDEKRLPRAMRHHILIRSRVASSDRVGHLQNEIATATR